MNEWTPASIVWRDRSDLQFRHVGVKDLKRDSKICPFLKIHVLFPLLSWFVCARMLVSSGIINSFLSDQTIVNFKATSCGHNSYSYFIVTGQIITTGSRDITLKKRRD